MYPDRRQKDTDGAKNGFGRSRARALLHGIHGLDCFIQQGEIIILMFLPPGVRIHGRRSW